LTAETVEIPAARAPIAIVDDDASVRAGLSALLEADEREVRAFADWESFLAARRAAPGPLILLLDIRLGRSNGLELYATLAGEGLACPVIFMTAYADVSTAVEALRLSATDFLEKPCSRADLFAAIARAEDDLAEGPEAGGVADAGELTERYESLSPREAEVFAAMAAGETTKVIARRLGISPRTVEVHRSRVMHKMGSDSLAALVRMAVALRLPNLSA
jgi:FixJ family two-component response regulator